MTDRRRKSSASIRRRGAALLAAAAILSLPGTALPIAGDPAGPIGLDGSFRAIPLYLDNEDVPALFGADDTERRLTNTLRLVLSGRPRRNVAYEIHGLLNVERRSDGGGLFDQTAAVIAGGAGRHRGMDLTYYTDRDEEWTGDLSADRLLLRISRGRADLTVGRQAVTYGKAWFWNPLDVFAPFDPRRFDRDYKSGVDAARLDMALGLTSGVTVVGAAGEKDGEGSDDFWNGSNYGSSLLGRVFTTVLGFDVAAQGGKVYGGYQWGGAASGEIGPLEARAECAWFDARDPDPLPWPLEGDELEDRATWVAGVGRWFESGLDLQLEYLDQGLADPDDRNASLARVAAGHAFHMSRRLLGGLASYDILPIVTGSVAGLVSLDDGSFQVQPGVRWSTGDDSEFVLGGIVNFGDEPRGNTVDPGIRSEFGTYPHVLYMEFKIYF
ncbi:MAG: hypothetical protein ABIK65_00700 [Candidatus Eisenbacteria bacterium]